MNGYIIFNECYLSLTRRKYWFKHTLRDCYVWTKEEVIEIFSTCSNWRTKPKYIKKTFYNKDTGKVSTEGELMLYTEGILE